MRKLGSAVILLLLLPTIVAAADPPPPPPNVLGLAEGAADVKFASLNTASSSVTINVLNTSAKDAAKNVRVFASGLVVKGKESDTAAALDLGNIGPNERKSIRIDLRLPIAGEYTTTLWLMSDGVAPKSLPIKFVRAEAAKTPVTIEAISSIAINAPWNPREKASREVPFAVRSTAGVPLHGVRSSINVDRKVSDKVKFAAPNVTFDSPSLNLDPEAWTQVNGTISGLSHAGEYIATISLRSQRAAPATSAPFTIYVRESWRWAAALIAVGAFVSLLLRILTKIVRPRLALQNRVAVLLDNVRAIGRTAQGNAVVAGEVKRFEEAVMTRWDSLALTGRLVGSSAFDIWETKLPLLHGWAGAVTEFDGAKLPPAAVTLVRKAIADAQTVLDDNGATNEQITAQVTALAALRGKVDDEFAKDIHAKMDALRTAIAGDPNLQPLLARINEIDSKLIDLSAAEAAIEKLRIEYVKLSAASLQAMIQVRPTEYQGDWKKPAAEIGNLLTQATSAPGGDDAIAALRAAMLLYLNESGHALEVAFSASSNAKLTDLKTRLTTLMTKIADGKLDGAVREMNKLQDDYVKALSGGAQGKAEPVAATSAAGSGLENIEALVGAPAARVAFASGAVARTGRSQIAIGLIATILIALVAMILGVKVLWADDWTWGGPLAYLAAFLWGAGLHTFTYDGLAGLMDRW